MEQINKVKEVYNKATPLQAELDNTLLSVSAELGVPFGSAGQKTIESMADKVARKGYDVLDMKDHARGKITLNSFDDIPRALGLLRQKNIPISVEAVGANRVGL